ncbi:MAG TPA: response regulator [Candidatus Binatia bacterium]|nr:response regulator [Candidatus Binatia bacterium]
MNAASPKTTARPWEIFLVEDNPADIRLTQEVLAESGLNHHLHIARDGEQALYMIRRDGEYAKLPEPDLVLLDLNLPRKDGREVLAEIKRDPRLNHIPVLVLSTSRTERDVATCYHLHANCYLQKPVDLDAFAELMRGVEDFWLRKVSLPPRGSANFGGR